MVLRVFGVDAGEVSCSSWDCTVSRDPRLLQARVAALLEPSAARVGDLRLVFVGLVPLVARRVVLIVYFSGLRERADLSDLDLSGLGGRLGEGDMDSGLKGSRLRLPPRPPLTTAFSDDVRAGKEGR